MILYKITFGSLNKGNRSESEDLVHIYISALYHNGQAGGEYFIVLHNGKLCAYLNIQGIKGHLAKYHCKYGAKRLKDIEEHFGTTPKWQLIDDDAPVRDTTWRNAPFLYLYTNLNDWESPLRRGDNGKSIPIYLLSGEHEERESIYFWQRAYQNYDAIWMGCGELEIPVYRQLATPVSELSREGRAVCKMIENITGVPTYYYLMRHWGRRINEEARKCPGCGKSWKSPHKNDISSTFNKFSFQCKKCRLVSHIADSFDDERHAVIGEWRKNN